MKAQAETIKITDDIINNKFDEILSGKDIEEQQIMMGFIDKVKRYEFLRESFVQEVKNSINSGDSLHSVDSDAYSKISRIANDPVNAIYNAIIKNDINLVEALLTSLEVDPNTEFNKHTDSTFLEFACRKNNKQIAKLLLEKGADINSLSTRDTMPLFDAINDKHQDIVEFLLENNADPNIGENDRSCLDIAIFAKQDVSLVTTLLAHGANMEFETHGRPLFQRLLGYFINATGNQAKMDIIKVFLQYGANLDILTLGGKAVRDDETIYKPLRTLLTLESAFRKNDYKEIKSINKKDLVAFVQWKSGILPVEKNAYKDEYIKSLLELDKFSKQVEEESIKQPLIKCTVKKVADIIRGSVEGTITFDDELTYNTALDLLKKNGFQVQVTGEAEGHIDLV